MSDLDSTDTLDKLDCEEQKSEKWDIEKKLEHMNKRAEEYNNLPDSKKLSEHSKVISELDGLKGHIRSYRERINEIKNEEFKEEVNDETIAQTQETISKIKEDLNNENDLDKLMMMYKQLQDATKRYNAYCKAKKMDVSYL